VKPRDLRAPSERNVEIKACLHAQRPRGDHDQKDAFGILHKVELIDSRDTTYAGEKAYMFSLSANVQYLSDEELRAKVAQNQEPTDSTATSHATLN